MNVILSQAKLNGISKKGKTVFNWRGQFNLEFVSYILETFSFENSIVCDPFSGSGTVLYECAKRNLQCVGMDINPSAYYMSKFFAYANFCEYDRVILIKNVKNKITNLLLDGETVFANFVRKLAKISSGEELCFVINILFIASKSKKMDIEMDQAVWKAFQYVEQQLISLPVSTNLIDVSLKDVRELTNLEYENKFNLIFTSPPYINVFNYHQNHRKVVELLGWEILNIARSEIGSNRKNRGNRFKTVAQYCADMLVSISGFWNALKNDGIVILVLGKASVVRGVEFFNGDIMKDLLEETRGFSIQKCYERSFRNKFGQEIYEDVIVCKKNMHIVSNEDIGKKVAVKHLQRCLDNTKISGEICNDIIKTIEEIQFIESSPILDVKRSVVI